MIQDCHNPFSSKMKRLNFHHYTNVVLQVCVGKLSILTPGIVRNYTVIQNFVFIKDKSGDLAVISDPP